MKKAVSEIITVVLIVTITLGLTSTAYLWGIPLIEKRQQATISERVFEQFNQKNSNSLPRIVEDIANNRGTASFVINADGAWVLNEGEDSIEFTFASKTSNIAPTGNQISLTRGVQCTPLPSPATGSQGFDSSSVVCVKSVLEGDVFAITYKIWFRELYDNPLSDTATGFKIDLIKDPTGLSSSVSNTVKITFSESSTQTIGSRTLITKKIKILLI